jgi:hypothetical protein
VIIPGVDENIFLRRRESGSILFCNGTTEKALKPLKNLSLDNKADNPSKIVVLTLNQSPLILSSPEIQFSLRDLHLFSELHVVRL